MRVAKNAVSAAVNLMVKITKADRIEAFAYPWRVIVAVSALEKL